MTDVAWGRPPEPQLLSGREPIAGTDATVADLWAWTMSDLRTNTVRPVLAEFLVARALGVAGRPRVEWEPYDVLTPDCLRIEVKSSAYLQSWEQAKLSRIEFRGLTAHAEFGAYRGQRSYNADGYVFGVQTAVEHLAYDPLDVAQWAFWVLPVAAVAATGCRSLGLATVRSLAGPPVSYGGLTARVHEVLAIPAP